MPWSTFPNSAWKLSSNSSRPRMSASIFGFLVRFETWAETSGRMTEPNWDRNPFNCAIPSASWIMPLIFPILGSFGKGCAETPATFTTISIPDRSPSTFGGKSARAISGRRTLSAVMFPPPSRMGRMIPLYSTKSFQGTKGMDSSKGTT